MAESLKTAREKREERARLVAEQRSLVNGLAKDDKGQRVWTPEAQANFDAIHVRSEALKAEYEKIESETDREALLAEEERELSKSRGTIAGRQDTPPEKRKAANAAEARRKAFRAFAFGRTTPEHRSILGMQTVELDGEDAEDVDPRILGADAIRYRLRAVNPLADHRRVWNRDTMKYEHRGTDPQSASDGADGGYTVADEPMRALEDAMLQFGGMRQSRATVLRTSTGASLPIPTQNDTANKGSILNENTQTTTVTQLTFAQVVLGAFKYSSDIIKVSLEFLQDTSINAETFIAQKLGERIGRITNDHFTKGSNSSQPYGAAWAASLGKTVASATAITFQEVIDLEHSVDPAYRGSAEFMFADGTLAALKKLGDATGQWIWQPGLQTREPDRILGYGYVINQSMDTPAAGKHSMLFGDFSKYYIRDVMDVMVVRMNERFIDYGQIGFLAFSRHDGDLVDAGTHPIKYLRHPAS